MAHRLRSNFPRGSYLWAVRNVNLKVRRGDRLAILGRNAAGKSTLLKILSRITEPTRGRLYPTSVSQGGSRATRT